ncbi:MAG: bifunctional 5,10-methylenetetrahydrofolate dehydrogenase/5,10-methenyltetrahydrofolate cyclohydrolase [Patescibacteria group bacterium]
MAKILDGKILSEKIFRRLRNEVKKSIFKPSLAVILVGDNLVSKLYIKQKEKACENIGISFRLFQFPFKISTEKLKKEVKEIAEDQDNSGVIIQLPLPKNIDTQDILDIIPPGKDVDVLSEKSLGNFYTGDKEDFSVLPPVVEAISHFLKEYSIKIEGKNIVLVGAGRLVGKPLAVWFAQKNVNLSVVNESTKNISDFTKKADILISGVGKANLIKGNIIKKGAVIFDVGSSIKNGKTAGDVDFGSVSKKAGYITPVPGGVGPVTVACLLENLVRLNQ